MSTDFGLRVSEEGYDVLSCGEENLIFTSKYPLLKVYDSGSGDNTFSFTGSSHHVIKDYSADLNYLPFFLVWVDLDDGEGWRLLSSPAFASPTGGDYLMNIFGTCKSGELILTVSWVYVGGFWGDTTNPDDTDVDYKWVIFYEPAYE
jgi:hypothetical protein